MSSKTRSMQRNIARNNMVEKGYKSGVNRKIFPDMKNAGRQVSFFSQRWREFLVAKPKKKKTNKSTNKSKDKSVN